MSDINTVILTGRLTKNPEIKKTPSGVSVVQFALGVNDIPTKNNETVAYFPQCVAWRTQADFLANYCKKGDALTVEGKLTTRHYTHSTTNQEVYITEVVCRNIVKSSWEQKPQIKADPLNQFDTGALQPINDDSLPF